MATPGPVDVFSIAVMAAVALAVVGLVAGLLYAGIGFFIDLRGPGLNWGTALAFLAVIGMPIMFAIVGFILGTIGALLYNLVR